MPAQSGERLEQKIDEYVTETGRRPILEVLEVDREPNDREMRIQTRAEIHRPFENLH